MSLLYSPIFIFFLLSVTLTLIYSSSFSLIFPPTPHYYNPPPSLKSLFLIFPHSLLLTDTPSPFPTRPRGLSLNGGLLAGIHELFVINSRPVMKRRCQ